MKGEGEVGCDEVGASNEEDKHLTEFPPFFNKIHFVDTCLWLTTDMMLIISYQVDDSKPQSTCVHQYLYTT